MYQSRRDIQKGSGVDYMRFLIFTMTQAYFYFCMEVHVVGRVAPEKENVLVGIVLMRRRPIRTGFRTNIKNDIAGYLLIYGLIHGNWYFRPRTGLGLP